MSRGSMERRSWQVARSAIVAITLGAQVFALGRAAEAASHGHRGSGYGLAGGLSPDLALGNVFSGIYGLGYTYDRPHYSFNGCARRTSGTPQGDLTVRGCR